MGDTSSHDPQPPKLAKRFLIWFLRSDLIEEVEGDLYEKYLKQLESSTSRKAQVMYWYQVLQYLRPFAIRNFSLLPQINSAMFGSYLKITFRNLFRQRIHSLINILGLSISLAVVFLILLWVHDEWSTDKFHVNGENIFRVKRTIPLEGEALDVYRGISYPVLKAAADDLPEVREYIPIGFGFEDNLQIDDRVIRATGTFSKTSYFEAFSFSVLQGDVSQLDKKVDAIAISEDLAGRFFGDDWHNSALGKTIHIHDNGDFTIEAIYDNFPANSSLQNDFLYSFQSFLDANEWVLEWTNNGMQGAILLEDGTNAGIVQSKLEKIFQSHQERDRKEGILLQKFDDDYLFGEYDDQARVAGGRIEYVRIFLIAALLLLVISCINFVNLATARAANRAKEVGVRKTIGAGRGSLISQFIIEAFSVTIISVCLALGFTRLLIPYAELITEKTFQLNYASPFLWLTIIGITLITGILSGAYPAFVLSGYRPMNVLKGQVSEKLSDVSLRKGLVVLQFVLSLLLIVSALVVREQVDHIQTAHLGMDKDNLMSVHQDALVTEKYDVLEQELESNDAIAGVTVAGPQPHQMQASTSGVSWTGKRPDQENIEFSILWTAYDFPEVFNIPLSYGSYYRDNKSIDTTHIVLNEKAVEIMNFKGNPVGKSIQWWGKPRQIIGVLKDFHNQSFYEEISPSGFLLDPENAGNLFIKLQPDQVPEAIAVVEDVFSKVVPDVPLHFEFVDDEYQQQYKSEMLTGKLSNYFAMISIFISCLGLLGLITFVAEQKTREIGIRKVLGASVFSLVALLSRQFILLVMLAFVIAIPLSYYFLSLWLEHFAYHAIINWGLIFSVVGFGAVVITFGTISIQSLKAALNDPMESLRTE